MKNPRTLRHLVTIQVLEAGSPAQKPNGEPDVEWVDYLTVSASMRALSGRELFAAQEHHSEIKTVCDMRYRPNITADMRLAWDARYFEVLYVDDITLRHHAEMRVYCSEGVVFERDPSLGDLLLEGGGTLVME